MTDTNLNDIPVLNDCSEQLFVFRVILLLLQVSCMLDGKMEKKKRCVIKNKHDISDT